MTTTKYKSHHPAHYPVAWNTAARIALGKPGEWVSVDRGATHWAAARRMKRLRAFRDGLQANPQAIFGAAGAFMQGLTLAFRAQEVGPVWDVQLRWVPGAARKGLGELLGVVEQALAGDD